MSWIHKTLMELKLEIVCGNDWLALLCFRDFVIQIWNIVTVDLNFCSQSMFPKQSMVFHICFDATL